MGDEGGIGNEKIDDAQKEEGDEKGRTHIYYR